MAAEEGLDQADGAAPEGGAAERGEAVPSYGGGLTREAERGEASPSAPHSPGLLVDELRAGRAPPTLLAVVLAWATTLAPSGFSRGSTMGASLLAVAALVAGLGGPLLARRNPRAGRHLGISLFVALAVATWLSGSHAIHPLRLDPVRGAFGGIAWGVFALSWSDRWGPRLAAVPADPEAPLLLPRAALPLGALPIAAFAVAAAIGYLVLAFWVRDPDRALGAQAAALACAVAVVTGAGVVATARGKRRQAGGRRLTPPVVRALLLLCAVAVGGAIVTALRR